MILIVIVGLILIGVLSNYFGKVFEKFKLPSLIGMIIFGIIVGPSFLNFVPKEILNISSYIKDIALVTVLFIGGLGISVNDMKKIGRPAIFLSVIPATIEGFTIAILSMVFLDFSFIQGGILGFIISAVSPAVLIPSMVDLIERKIGEKKGIPKMLLVGASADDTVAITFFTTFMSLYFSKIGGEKTSILSELLIIPISIILSMIVGFLISFITKYIFKLLKSNILKALLCFFICLGMRWVENSFHIEIFNSLLTIMVYGFFLRTFAEEISKDIQNKMNVIWKYGKLYLFAFVGMAINPFLVGKYFLVGIIILIISLTFRSFGVILSLIGTDLTLKEKLFCVIAYLPKATVQSAKSGIPLQAGVLYGDIMQAISILSVLITAPIGAIGIKLTSTKLLNIDS